MNPPSTTRNRMYPKSAEVGIQCGTGGVVENISISPARILYMSAVVSLLGHPCTGMNLM